MNNTLLDNSTDFRMVRYIKDLLNNPQCTELKIATGYWDLPGTKLIYDELKSFFERGGRFDLLIGQEPMLRSYMMTEAAVSEKFPDFYIQRDIEHLHDNYKDVAQLLIDHMDAEDEENAPLRVHVYGQGEEKKFLHAKCYIFLGRGFAHGIIGSSNFTQKGLEENAELNYLETENSVVIAPDSIYSNSKSHLTWFKEKWNESEPWTGEFIKILTGPNNTPNQPDTDIAPITPYEVYVRLLQDCFGTDDDMDKTLFDYLDGTPYTRQPYQLDAVKQCDSIMLKMGGFLLADVVGLGKTVVGALVIRYYLEHIKKTDGAYNDVLVVVPPAIKGNWEDTIRDLDANKSFKMAEHIDFITTGSMVSFVDDIEDDSIPLELKPKDYGLIIIDESHRFRNKGTQMYESLNDLILNIRSNTGESPYIGLVSATPQNNRPEELQNQISFFVPTPKNSQFTRIPGRNFEAYFADVKNKFREIVDPIQDRAKLIALSNDIRDKILNDIIVRRTRTDIVTNYPNSIEFPTTVGPNVLKYEMSSTLAQLFDDSVDEITTGIGYHRYSAIARLKSAAHKKRYEGKNMDVKTTSNRLAKIMKLLLIKRLESSFDAFKESLENLGCYTQNMIDMWNDDTIFICPQLDVNAIMAKFPNRQDAYKELRNRIAALPKHKNNKGQNAEYHCNDFDAGYINDLNADKNLIDALLTRWQANTDDPKLDKFQAQLPTLMASDIARLNDFFNQLSVYAKEHPEEKATIDEMVENLKGLSSKLTEEKTKLVIFSEAIPTVEKIYNVAQSLGYRALKITAENREKDKDIIAENFDANYKGVKKNNYDIIITTEVLAEGVNLHRANAILNYDAPWNAARLIQRIGRVNRIGSKSKAVFVYNFFPSAKGNLEISLVENAYRKLQAFHTQFGEDDRVFNPCEVLSPAAFNTIVSGPASWQVKFMKELKDYKENSPERFTEIMAFEAPIRIAISLSDMASDAAQDAIAKETLCVVKNSTSSTNFYVKVDAADQNAESISMQQVLEHCQCKIDAVACPLPPLDADEKKAMDAYAILQQQRIKILRQNKNITEAQRILATVWASDSRFDAARPDLKVARQLVDAGDLSTAKSIIAINNDIESKQTTAIPYTAKEIADIINQKMKNLAAKANQKYGQSTIFITFNKN